MKAEMAKAANRARAGETPIDCAASSLPRSARNVRPIVPLRMWTTARPTMTSAMATSTR